MSNVEQLARRLRARGSMVLMPTTRNVVTFQGERDGHLVTETEPVDCWLVHWWPRGQGPGRKGGGNPFCQRSFEADTIEEALQEAVKVTAPRRVWIDDRVAEHLGFKDDLAYVGLCLGRLLAGAA